MARYFYLLALKFLAYFLAAGAGSTYGAIRRHPAGPTLPRHLVRCVPEQLHGAVLPRYICLTAPEFLSWQEVVKIEVTPER